MLCDRPRSLNNNNTPSALPSKTAQEENIIADLKKFFAAQQQQAKADEASRKNNGNSDGKLSEDVKEVTKLEMRNDLSKRQLLYILLASLLEDNNNTTSGVAPILNARIPLFKTVSVAIFSSQKRQPFNPQITLFLSPYM